MKNAARPIYKSNERAHDSRPAFRLRPIAYCVMLACCDLALANPNGPQVISGNVQFQGLGTNNLSITNTPGAIINWQGFSINAGQLTQFLQQNAASTVLNRVVGGNISQIQGQLQSNGRVFLINPAGIVIGAGAVIDTAGFVGSTLNMLDADFLKGKLSFQGDGTPGSIVNQGFIKTTHGGDVVLVAPNVENSGIIHADGKILLAAGHKLTIGSLDANDVQFEVQAPSDSVLNVGELLSKGGAVGAFAGTLKHTGDIRATAMGVEGGRIVLKSQGDTILAGNSTTVATGDKGGTVQVLGDRVGIFDNSKIDASGEHGGGTVLIGGDYRGSNPLVQNANITYVSPGSSVRADATAAGDGGKLIVWANDTTRAYGTLTAAGAGGGMGGFIETSGKIFLDVAGASVTPGAGGTWLLDPRNIRVTNSNVNNSGPTGFTPGAANAESQVNAAQIASQLQAGTNVTLDTSAGPAGGTQAGDITVESAITRTLSGSSSTLTLNADNAINVTASISVPGSSIVMTAGRAAGSTGGITIAAPLVSGVGSGVGDITLTATRGNIVLQPASPTILFRLQGDGINNNRDLTFNATSPTGTLINNAVGSIHVFNGRKVTVNTSLGMTGTQPTFTAATIRDLAVDAGSGSAAFLVSATNLALLSGAATGTSGTPSTLAVTMAANQTLTVTAGGGSGGSGIDAGTGGTVRLVSDNFAINNTVKATGGTVELAPVSGTMTLGGADATGVLTAAELNNVTAPLLTLGRSNGTTTATGINLAGSVAPASVNALSLHSTGTITRAAGSFAVPALQATGTDVTLFGNTNNIVVAGNASGAFSLTNSGNVQVGTVGGVSGITATGNATITANQALDAFGGLIPGTGTITGSATVTGNNVVLDSVSGVGTTSQRLNTAATTLSARSRTSGSVLLNELNAVTLSTGAFANGAAGGTTSAYDLIAGDAITVTGAVNNAGTGATTLNSTAGSGVVANASVGNGTSPTSITSAGTITGSGTIFGSSVVLDSATGVGTGTGGRVTVGQTTLAARSRTSGGVFVGGTTVLTLADIGGISNGAKGSSAYDALLAGIINVNSPVNTAALGSTGTTTLTANPLTTTRITVGADVGNPSAATTLTSTSNITSTGGTVNGTDVTLSAGTDIGTAANRINTSAVTLAARSGAVAGSVFVTEANAVTLGTLGIANGAPAGSYDFSAGGPVTITGNVSTAAAGTLQLTTTGGSTSTINQTGGTLTTGTLALTTTNADVTLPSVNAITNLGAISLGTGRLTLTNGLAIQQAGGTGISAGGGTFNAGANLIALTSATNDFTGPVSLTSTGGGVSLNDANAVTLGATNTGGAALTVTAGGAIAQSGAILASTGAFNANGNAITLTNTGNDFTGPVTFTNNTATVSDVSITDATALAFGISGAGGYRNFTATALGGALSVPALTTSGAQTFTGNSVALNGDLTTTNGSISITGPTTFGANRILTAGNGGDLTLNGTVNGAGLNLTLNSSGTTTLGGAVGGGAGLGSLTTNGGGTTQISANVTTAAAQTYGDAVTLGADVTLQSNATTGTTIRFMDTLDSDAVPGAGRALTLNSGVGTTTVFDRAVGGTRALASLTTNAGGTTAINGGSVRTTGNQTYNDAVTLGATTLLTGDSLTYATIAGGGNDLGLAFTGTTTLNGATLTGVRNLSTDTQGTTNLTGIVTTTGSQQFNDNTVLTGATTLTSTGGSGALGAITLAGPLSGAQTLAVNTGGVTTFSGTVTGLTSITTDNAGSTSLGASITTTGAQTYGDAITLQAGTTTTLASTGGGAAGIVAGATLNGPGALVVSTVDGVATLPAATGGTTPLASITTGTGGTTSVSGTVTTVNGQTYNNALFMRGDTTLVSNNSGNIILGSFVDGAQALTVNTGGITRFGGAVGAFAGQIPLSLTTDGGGTTEINTASIRTQNTQTYGDAVILGVPNVTLTSTNNVAITFGGTLNGASNLTLTTTGDKTLGALVGGATALTSVSSLGGTTFVSGGVTTTGNQTYGGVTLTGNSAFTGATGSFVGAIAGNGNDLALNFSADTTLTAAAFANVNNLSVGGGGTTTINGDIATTGSQTYNDAITLGTATNTLVAGAGGVAFNNTVNGNSNLTVTTAGTTTFGGAVGGAGAATQLNSLAVNGGGTTAINGGSVRTAGVQTYTDNVTLGADTALTAGGAITFAGTLQSPGTPRALTITTTADTTFSGAVGGAGNPLASLTMTAGGGTTHVEGGGVTTAGAQTYNNPVGVVTTAGTFASTAGGAIAFGSTLDGDVAITVNTSGATTFTGVVGGALNLPSLTTDALGTTTISGGAVTTSGAQTYNDAVTLTANTLFNAGGGNLTFGSTLNGGVDVNANSTGTTTFGGAVGGTAALTSLTTNALGTTAINGGSIRTLNGQTYNDNVTLGADATLNAGAAITFAGTVQSPVTARALTVTSAGGTTFGGLVGGGGNPLASLTITAGGGTTSIAGGGVTTTGAQLYGGAATIANDAILTSGGDVHFGSTVQSPFGTPRALTVNAAGETRFSGAVGGAVSAELASLTTDGAGTTRIDGGSIVTTGAQTYGDAVILGAANTTLTSNTNAAIAFGGTLNGASSLTLTTTGDKTFGALVGGGTALTSVSSLGGTTFVRGGVTTTGNQTYGGVTLTGNSAFTGATGTFGGTIAGGGFDLALNFSGPTTLNAATFAAINNLSVGGGGTTTVNGNITTTGSQTYNDAITLGSAANTLSAGNAGVTFTSTVEGNSNLTVTTAGTTTFGGAVGGAGPATQLDSLTVNGGGTAAINGGSIRTANGQAYNNVTLGADTTLTGGGAISFAGTVQSPGTARALTVTTPGGTTFGGLVGGAGNPLASLTMTAGGGTTTVTGGGVTTTGAQSYNNPVSVGTTAATFGSTTGGAITFASTLDGGVGVTVNTGGATTFTGAVGGTTNLASLTTDAGGTTAINGGAVTTTGAQSYNDAVTLGANTTLDAGGGNLFFGSTLDGAVALNANSGGITAFAGAVGGVTPLTSLTTNGAGTTSITGGSIRTTGAQTYNDAVTATAAALAATGPGASITATNPLNDFTGVTSFNTTGAGNVSVTDANAITFGTTSVPGGTLAVIARDGIAQTGAITANTLTIQTTNANAALNGATNAITTLGASDLGTGTLNLLDAGGLNVAGVVVAGGATLNTTGALTDSAGARIVTAGANGPIALTGTTIGTAATPFSVNAGTGTVNATSTTGGAFIEQSSGDVLTSRYTFNVPAGQTIGLAANVGGITVDANVNAPGRTLALSTFTAGNTIGFGDGVTVNAGALSVDTTAASATLSFPNSAVTLNTPVTTGANVSTAIAGASNVTANGAVNLGGPLSWSGTGTIGGTGGVTVGTLNMVGGSPHLATTLNTTTYDQGPGGLTVDNNGTLNLLNAASATLNGTQLVNNGRVNVAGAGSVMLRNNGELRNNGILDLQGDVSLDSNTPGALAGSLVNAAGATVQKSAGSGTSAIGAAGALTFTNGGVLNAQTGTIEYRQSSNTFAAGTQFTGAGTHLITGNSAFNGAATNSGNLTVGGGTQTVLSSLTNDGTFSFNAGTIALTGAAGALTNNAGKTFSIGAGAGNITADGSQLFSNAGTLTSAGNHQIGNGGATRFANTGTVRVTSGGLIISASDVDGAVGSNGPLGDTGTYTVDTSLAFSDSSRDFLAGSSIGGAGSVTFASTSGGTFNVRAPYNPAGTTFIRGNTTVNFFGATTMAALDMNNGTMGIGAGGVLNLTGTGTTSITGGTLTNAGEIDVTGGTASFGTAFPTNAGIVRIGGGATLLTNANLTNASTGFIGGTGTLNVGAGNTFTNNGTFSPGASPGTFTITGNYTQGPTGTMAIELGGTNQGVTYDLVNVSGTATLGGALNVALVNGFTPTGSDRFDFMTFASRVGDFGTFAFPTGSGLISQPGATSYALVGTLLPFDISGELRRLYDDLQRLAAEDAVQEVKIVKGGRLICE